MSEVERPAMLLPRFGAREKCAPEETAAPASAPQAQLSRTERRTMLGGALTAGLLIALVFALGFAALILLIQWIWG